MNKEIIAMSNNEITLDSIIKDISKILQNAEQIDAVFMCFSIREEGQENVNTYSRGNAFEVLELVTRGVPYNAERVGIACVKKLIGRIEVDQDEE